MKGKDALEVVFSLWSSRVLKTKGKVLQYGCDDNFILRCEMSFLPMSTKHDCV